MLSAQTLDQQIQQKLQKIDISQLGLPQRASSIKPQNCQPVQLQSNFFRFKIIEQNPTWIYSLDIEPPNEKFTGQVIKGFIKQVRKQIEQKLGRFIYGGQKLFAEGKQEVKELLSFQVVDQEDNTYKLSIKSINRVIDCSAEGQDPLTLQYLNITRKKLMRKLTVQRVGRYKYLDPIQIIQIKKYGMNIWPCQYTTVQYVSRGIFLSVDSINQIFKQDNVLEYIKQLRTQHGQYSPQVQQRIIYDELVGQEITSYGNNQKYKVTDIA